MIGQSMKLYGIYLLASSACLASSAAVSTHRTGSTPSPVACWNAEARNGRVYTIVLSDQGGRLYAAMDGQLQDTCNLEPDGNLNDATVYASTKPRNSETNCRLVTVTLYPPRAGDRQRRASVLEYAGGGIVKVSFVRASCRQ